MGPVNARSIATEGYLQILKIIHPPLCKKNTFDLTQANTKHFGG